MGHYEIQEWVDYARGACDEPKRAEMRAHVDGSCSRCKVMLQTFERVAQAAASESGETPPEHAVRAAERLFAVQQPKSRERFKTLRLEMMFDASLAPAMAGARSRESLTRRLLFESSDYSLDLETDTVVPGRENLVGQIIVTSGDPVAGRPVYAVSGEGEITSSALTDYRGCFVLEDLDPGESELWLFPQEDLKIAVDLGPFN